MDNLACCGGISAKRIRHRGGPRGVVEDQNLFPSTLQRVLSDQRNRLKHSFPLVFIRWRDEGTESLKRGGCDEREKQRGKGKQEGATEKPQREEKDQKGEEEQVGYP